MSFGILQAYVHTTYSRHIFIKEEKTDDRETDKILDQQDFCSTSLRCQGDFRQARSQEVRFQVVDLTDQLAVGRPADRPRGG